MIGPAKLRRIVANRIFKRRSRLQPTPVTGVPEGIDYDTLSELCLERTGAALKKVSFVHVSGWKRAGAYRIFLENRRGSEWRLIYKNAVYNLEHIPALQDFPVTPGPPEFLVYGHANGRLARYLPEIYLCAETVRDKRYQYLLEDLSSDFIPVAETDGRKIKFTVAAQLPAFHSAMGEWLSSIGEDRLLRYDRDFSRALRDYTGSVLQQFAHYALSPLLREALDKWPQLSALSLLGNDKYFDELKPIHGDANGSNILVHRKDPTRIKFIDWEWAGLGMPFADMVSLFRRGNAEINKKLVTVYSENGNGKIVADALRQYGWCRLERSMLDAAYIGAQYMGSSEVEKRKDDAWAPKFVENSLATMLDAYAELAE